VTEVKNIDNLIQNTSAEEILQFLLSSGSIDLDGIAEQLIRARREKILGSHPYNIYQDKDGRWRTYVKDTESRYGRKAIVKATREKLEEALCEYYSELDEETRKRNATLASLYPKWLEYKKLHVEKTTVDRIQRDWNKYYDLDQIVHKKIKDLTKLDLDTWVHEMIRRYGMNKHKYTNFSLILRQELDYAVDLGIIKNNPFREVTVNAKRVLVSERKKPDETQVFTKDELQKLEEMAWKDFETKHYCKHQLTPLAVMFMFLTGARVGEVCAIRYSDIKEDMLTICRMIQYPSNDVVEHTKGTFGDRVIPLVPRAMELIREAKKRQQEENAPDDGYVFSMDEKPLLYTSVTKAFYRYCREMGIEAKSSHKARKTFVSSLIDGGVNINTVRQIAGHKDERTTLNNYCFDRSDNKEKKLRMAKALG